MSGIIKRGKKGIRTQRINEEREKSMKIIGDSFEDSMLKF